MFWIKCFIYFDLFKFNSLFKKKKIYSQKWSIKRCCRSTINTHSYTLSHVMLPTLLQYFRHTQKKKKNWNPKKKQQNWIFSWKFHFSQCIAHKAFQFLIIQWIYNSYSVRRKKNGFFFLRKRKIRHVTKKQESGSKNYHYKLFFVPFRDSDADYMLFKNKKKKETPPQYG